MDEETGEITEEETEEEGQEAVVPETVEPPSAVIESVEVGQAEQLEVKQEEESSDDLDDLFEVPQPEDNDMAVDHLVARPEEDDLSDLVEVSEEDIMGEPLVDQGYGGEPAGEEIDNKRYRIKPKGRRLIRQIQPTSMRGMRY